MQALGETSFFEVRSGFCVAALCRYGWPSLSCPEYHHDAKRMVCSDACFVFTCRRETGGEARAAIDPADSLWALDSDQDAAGDPVRVLALHLAKTPVSESEITWKKGELLSHAGSACDLLKAHGH